MSQIVPPRSRARRAHPAVVGLTVSIPFALTPLAQATTVVDSSTTTQTLSTDTSYVLNAGTTVSVSSGDGLVVNGIAPATLTNAGIVNARGPAVAAIRFTVSGSLINTATGGVTGQTFGVMMDGTGTFNIRNDGDISVATSHAIQYSGSAGGTIDNYGTLNGSASTGAPANGVRVLTDGTVAIVNHAGGSIRSGAGTANFGRGILIESGSATITNDGLISGHHEGIQNLSSGTVSITNGSTGTITGDLKPGVTLAQANTLVNNGLISSVSAPAILLAGANNRLTLGTGSTLSGAAGTVLSSQGTGNTLTLNGTGAENGNIVASAAGNGLAQLTAAADSNWTLGGNIALSGASPASLDVAGKLALGGTLANDGTGGVTVEPGGTLALGNANALLGGGPVTVGASATLGGLGRIVGNVTSDGTVAAGNAMPGLAAQPPGMLTIAGDLANRGTVLLAGASVGNTLLVTGNYSAASALVMNTALGGDNSPTDRLVVQGNTSGQTAVTVRNAGGAGALTTNGIRIVQVDGQSNGIFALGSRAVAGAYEYALSQGSADGTDPSGWYLRSSVEPVPPAPPTPPEPPRPRYRPEAAAYLVNQRLSAAAFVHSLHDRLGEPQFAQAEARAAGQPLRGGWLRMAGRWEGSNSRDGNFKTDSDLFALQAGLELAQWRVATASDRLHAGVMAGYTQANSRAEATGNTARAHGDMEGYQVGVYGTWYQNDENKLGAYADAWFQYGWFRNSVKGDTLPTVSYDASGLGVSGEFGYAFPLPHGWVIEPQAQLIYVDYGENDITEPNGTRVHGADASGVITRLGVRLSRTFQRDTSRKLQPYATLNWWHDSTDSSIRFNDVPLGSLYPNDRYEVKLGLNAALGRQWTAWGNVSGVWGQQSYYQYTVRAGIKYTW